MFDWLGPLIGAVGSWLSGLGSTAADVAPEAAGASTGNMLSQVVGAAIPQIVGQGLGAGVNALMGKPTGGVRTTDPNMPGAQNAYQQLLSDYSSGQQGDPLMSDPNLAIATQQAGREARGNSAVAGMADSGQGIQSAQRAMAGVQYNAANQAAGRQVQRAGQIAGTVHPQTVTPYGPYTPYSQPGQFGPGAAPRPTGNQYGATQNPYTRPSSNPTVNPNDPQNIMG